MRTKLLLLLLCMSSLCVMGQIPVTRGKCDDCGKAISQCEYQGKHPKCPVCGKIKEKCQYKFAHPKCNDCGKLLQNCPYRGKHPKCPVCGKIKEKCQYKFEHPKCNDCGKLLGKCPYKGKHPKCLECGELLENCKYGGKHPAPTPTEYNVRFYCNVQTATVFVDDKNMGSVNSSKSLKAGSHSIRITADGYEPYTGVMDVNAQNTSLTVSLKQIPPIPTTGTVSVGSNPSSSKLTFTPNGVSFNMILVEHGTFTMGATSKQGSDAFDGEKPVHQVTLTKDYYIGETEVTQALWKAVTGYSPTSSGSSWTSTYGLGNNYPAYYISYNDVQSFITKLNSLTGKTFRMPTEAEWEFAARGGNKSKGYKYSGSKKIGDVAWYKGNASSTHQVKTKSPNELGIYDMSGNVYEWCSDWYGSYGSSSQTNPTGPTSGTIRVYRGGSWSGDAGRCRVSYRHFGNLDNRISLIGFRLVLSE